MGTKVTHLMTSQITLNPLSTRKNKFYHLTCISIIVNIIIYHQSVVGFYTFEGSFIYMWEFIHLRVQHTEWQISFGLRTGPDLTIVYLQWTSFTFRQQAPEAYHRPILVSKSTCVEVNSRNLEKNGKNMMCHLGELFFIRYCNIRLVNMSSLCEHLFDM